MKNLCPVWLVLLLWMPSCKQNDLPVPPVSSAAFRLLDSVQMQSDLQALSSDAFMGRKAGTPEIALTHALIQQRLRAALLDSFNLGFAQPFVYNAIDRKNFLGLIKGTTYPDAYLVVSAHFDHLGSNANGIYHGADDNASGTAAVLAMAKYFQQHVPRHSIILALWDAEEVGLRGAKYFTNQLPMGISVQNLKFNLNLDMIARSDNNKLWACGLSHYPQFSYLVDSIKPLTQTNLISGFDRATDPQDWTMQSDHAAFHEKGIPFLYLGVEDHADYHAVTDTYDKIQINRFTENANIALQMLLLLDRKLN